MIDLLNKVSLFYSFWMQILYCVVLFLKHVYNISFNTPIILAIYLTNWIVCVFGLVITLWYGKDIVEIHGFNKKTIMLSILFHGIFIIPLLKYIPYKNENISKDIMMYTFISMCTSFSIYLIYLKYRKRNIYNIYKGAPLIQYSVYILVFILIYFKTK